MCSYILEYMPIKHIRKDEDIEKPLKDLLEYTNQLDKESQYLEKESKKPFMHKPVHGHYCICIDSSTKEIVSDLIVNEIVNIIEKLKGTDSFADKLNLESDFRTLTNTLADISTTKNCDELIQTEKDLFDVLDRAHSTNFRTEKETQFHKQITKILQQLTEEYKSVVSM